MPAQAQITGDVVVQGSEAGWLYDLGAVISVFVDAPLEQPEPVAIGWAPPPMLVEDIPPPPSSDAVWTGGYWTWQGDWVWSAGRWLVPPRPQYVWVQPYYEHRDERVIFVPGYWSRPDIEFVAPAYDRPVRWAYVGANVVVGPPPSGPSGVFIPPPPGSRPGIIVPAPVGTPPAVVVSAPPVMRVGMRIRGDVNVNSHNTVINDNRVTNYNVTNVRNITNVVIEAPAGATADGHAFQANVPHQAHLAAARKPVVQVRAPLPASRAAVQAYVQGHEAPKLPPPQKVQGMPAVPSHPVAALSPAQRSQLAHAPVVPPPHAPAASATAGSKGSNAPATLAQTRPDHHELPQPAKAGASQVNEAQPPRAVAAEQQNLRAQQEAARQRAQAEAQARQHEQQLHAQEQAQAQQREKQQQQQHAQAEAQAREREQHAQAEAQAAQARQQRAQAEAQAHQREQQQAQQQRMQAEQRAQKAQQEAAARAQQRAAQQQHAEHARPHGEEASRPANGHG